MHPKVRMFLAERDRAYARGDTGVIRSLNADLRRLGVRDDATLANPTGKGPKSRRAREEPVQVRPPGRPKLARCEHENVAERCEICNPELAAH